MSRAGVKAAPGHCSDVLLQRFSAGGKISWSQNQRCEMLGALYGVALADPRRTDKLPVLWQGNAAVLSVGLFLVLLCSEIWGFSLLLTNGCQGWEPVTDEYGSFIP